VDLPHQPLSYHAYPLWTQRAVILTAEQPAELAAQMEHAEHAARRPRASTPHSTQSPDGPVTPRPATSSPPTR
jgi:hypothetical protein